MIAQSTPTEKDFHAKLRARGCKPTKTKTNTGTIWKNKAGFHFLVPFGIDGFAPDWMQTDVFKNIDRMEALCAARKKDNQS